MKNIIKKIKTKLTIILLLVKPVDIYSLSNKGKKHKISFLNYFDGGYDFDPHPNTFNTFTMGVCKLDFDSKKNELTVYLRKPGLLIGVGGKTIDDLQNYLGCKINIIEVNLLK